LLVQTGEWGTKTLEEEKNRRDADGAHGSQRSIRSRPQT
jgi:hypothetical protein